MKDNKIDKLFRKKLEGHTKSPSPMAWEKLSGELAQEEKKNGFLWWHKAAVVLLVCISGFLIFRNENAPNENQVVSNDIKTDKENRQQTVSQQHLKEQENLQAQNLTRLEKEHTPPVSDNIKPVEPAEEKKASMKAPNADRALFLESPVVNNYLAENGGKNQEEESDQKKAGASDGVKENAETKKTLPPVSIEFRSGKRKKEQTLMADAEKENTREDQSFSFKRLVATVKDVKAGEIGLAELRQAKDDLFAFDTYKEDSTNQDR